jgi:hypothetical protein
MNPVPFTWMLLGLFIAFSAGGVSGAVVANRLNNAELYRLQAAKYRRNLEALDNALGLNLKIDQSADAVELTNEEISNAVLSSAKRLESVPIGWACVSVDDVLDVGRIN